jgi:hypothetical protein
MTTKEIKSITYHNVVLNSKDAKIIVSFDDGSEETVIDKMEMDKIVNKFKEQIAQHTYD